MEKMTEGRMNCTSGAAHSDGALAFDNCMPLHRDEQ